MIKIVSMSPLPGEFIQGMLESKGVEGVEVVNTNFCPPEEINNALREAEYIVADFSFHNKIDSKTVELLENTRFIQQPSVGYQHIDVEACTKVGIKVANCAGANTVDVAEHTVMSGLCLLKNIMMSNRTTRQGEWRQMEIGPVELGGKVWGIIGMGRIGKAVAERLNPFSVELVYYKPTRLSADEENKLNVTYRQFFDLLREADILSLHCPLTPETKNLMNADNIASMKSGAMLINVSRGEIVDEQALADALRKGKLAGAAVDVFSDEPITSDNPLLKVDSDNLILSPHVAGVSEESKTRIMNMSIDNLAKFIKGETPDSLIN